MSLSKPKLYYKVGHRGAAGLAPENTIASFQKAVASGADMVELDVHQCATGEIIVMHDETVNRTTNGSGKIKNLSLSEINSLLIPPDHTIPTLNEVLTAFKDKCFFNIEIKNKRIASEVLSIIKTHRAEDKVIISSTHVEPLTHLAQIAPHITTALIFHATKSIKRQVFFTLIALLFFPLARYIALIRLQKSKAQWLHYAIHLPLKYYFDFFKKRGYLIGLWTVNKPKDIARCKALGVDSIISDFPDRLS